MLKKLPKSTTLTTGIAATRNEGVGVIHGFDYLRVLFVMLVITGHAGLISQLAIARADKVGNAPNFWDYFYYQVQSCAVPAFVLISVVLFSMKPLRGREPRPACPPCFIYMDFGWVPG